MTSAQVHVETATRLSGRATLWQPATTPACKTADGQSSLSPKPEAAMPLKPILQLGNPILRQKSLAVANPSSSVSMDSGTVILSAAASTLGAGAVSAYGGTISTAANPPSFSHAR